MTIIPIVSESGRCCGCCVDRARTAAANTLAQNLCTNDAPRFVRVLADMFLHLVLESHFVPVVVQCDDGVDGIAEFGNQEQTKDRVEDLLVCCVDGPVAVEDRVAVMRCSSALNPLHKHTVRESTYQILPCLFTFGWNTGVTKRPCGARRG